MTLQRDPLEGVAQDATTLTDVVDDLNADGYTSQFVVKEGGVVECVACKSRVGSDHFVAAPLRRLEGASDPSDMLAVAALTCPVCDTRGTLVLNYGPEATVEDAQVLSHLERHGDKGVL